MDIVTYALCKKFTAESVDKILAGSADLMQYYKKGEVNDLIKDFITSADLPIATDTDPGMIIVGAGLEVAPDGTVVVSETGKGLKSEVVVALPNKSLADKGTIYFVPADATGTKMLAYVYNQAEDKYIQVGSDPTLADLMQGVNAINSALSSVDRFVVQRDNGDVEMATLQDISDSLEIQDFLPNTETNDGKAGFVPKPEKGDGIRVLTNTGWQDGEAAVVNLYNWGWNPETGNIEVGIVDLATDTVDPSTIQTEPIDVFKGATDIENGRLGIVPKPLKGNKGFLNADGTWSDLYLMSSNGTKYKLVVADDGTLSTEAMS